MFSLFIIQFPKHVTFLDNVAAIFEFGYSKVPDCCHIGTRLRSYSIFQTQNHVTSLNNAAAILKPGITNIFSIKINKTLIVQ